MYSNLVFVTVLFTLLNCCQAELKHVFITVTEAEHTPKNYEGAYKILDTEAEETLTKNGIGEAFDIGHFLAESYGTALGWNKTDITPSSFRICAINDKICELTALLISAGLCNKESNKYKNWTNADLESVYCSETDQYTKFFNKEECPAFFRGLKNKAPEFKASIKQMQSKTLAAIVKKFGAQSLQNPKKLWLTLLTLESMQSDKEHKMPEWATKQVVEDLKLFSKEFFKIACSNNVLKRLSGGRRLSSILTEIVEIIVDNFEFDLPVDVINPKMSILTAPQYVLASQIATFSTNDTKYKGKCILENVYPDRGAMHVIELHCNDEVWTIKVLLKTSTNEPLEVVKIQNDEDDCEVYEFVQLMAPYFLSEEELEEECQAL